MTTTSKRARAASASAAAPAPAYDPETLYDVALARVVSHDGIDHRPHPSLHMRGALLNELSVAHAASILSAEPVAPPPPLPPIEAQMHRHCDGTLIHRCCEGNETIVQKPGSGAIEG